MDHFHYKDGHLLAEDVAIAAIADDVGTPFYAYSTATIERHFTVFRDAFAGRDALVCYAVKANGNLAVVRTLARLGAGADVVSGGELTRALEAGVAPEKIVFSGVGKTRDEMAQALGAGILQLNVESEPELEMLSAVAVALGREAPVAIRINPDVDAETHEKIATGKSENKFGIPWTRARDIYDRAAALPGVRVTGMAMHIGSQITSLDPFRRAYERFRDVVADLRAAGHAIDNLDIGGGLGISYGAGVGDADLPLPEAYGAVVRDVFKDTPGRIIAEPGRVIVGNAGVLVTRVLYVKEGEGRRFIIVDAAMNDLMRPTLYGAYHAVWTEAEAGTDARLGPADVVGPICETGDTFAKDRPLPDVAPGDLLVLRTAGAYGATQSSTYNARALVPEVLVRGGDYAEIRRRFDIADQMALEKFPGWLSNS